MNASPDTTMLPDAREPGHGRGFSMLELIVTIAVLAILTLAAVPSLTVLVQDNRLISTVNNLVLALNQVRQEAVALNQEVNLCHSANAGAATPACGGTNSDWTTGYIMYAPQAGPAPTRTALTMPGTYDDANDLLLRKQDLSTAGAINFSSSAPNAPVPDIIGFNRDGRLLNAEAFDIRACDSRSGNVGFSVTVATTGRVTLAEDQMCP